MKTKTRSPFSYLHPSRFGPFAVIWSFYREEPKVIRILLSDPKAPAQQKLARCFRGAKASAHLRIKRLAAQIDRFLNGADVRFSLNLLRLDLYPDFQQKVLRVERAVSRGKVSTYQRIAKKIGRPRAARAVGTALANNPFPVIIPCHRVIRSDGAPGGYQGGQKMKEALLKMEGIRI